MHMCVSKNVCVWSEFKEQKAQSMQQSFELLHKSTKARDKTVFYALIDKFLASAMCGRMFVYVW